MQTFDGFPAGALRFISIPDLFFTELVPQIDNLAELKVTLHILWIHTRQARAFISLPELLADETLINSLAMINHHNTTALLHEGLQQAVLRKSLLHVRITDQTDEHDLYFLNSGRGRQVHEKFSQGEMRFTVQNIAEPVVPNQRKNIFDLYEENIGLISPILVDELKEAEELYPWAWIEEAFKQAAEQNARRWKYVRTILENWAAQGRGGWSKGSTTDGEKPWYEDEKFKNIFKR